MVKLHFEKLSRFDRNHEFVEAAVPFAKGRLLDTDKVLVHSAEDSPGTIPQTQVTSRWDDGSVKWLHISFFADLPGNAAKD
jgi:hypothetical protein